VAPRRERSRTLVRTKFCTECALRCTDLHWPAPKSLANVFWTETATQVLVCAFAGYTSEIHWVLGGRSYASSGFMGVPRIMES